MLQDNITHGDQLVFINNQGKMSTAESQQIKPKTKLQDFHTQI